MTKLVLPVCVFLACGCASQQVLPPSNVSSAPAAATNDPSSPQASAKGVKLFGNGPHRMTIYGRASTKAWPGVPATCVFTGVVLVHDRFSVPRQILLENMCVQERDGERNLYDGKHLWVKADGWGHYQLPFHDTHLEERDVHYSRNPGVDKKRLVFVTQFNGHKVEEALKPGPYRFGTLSFEPYLDDYHVRAIEN